MKSRKKLALTGCALVLTLSAVIVISTNKNESTSKLTDATKKASKLKMGKKAFTTAEVRLVYEAIKENKIAPFIAYLEEGGDLATTVRVDGKEITLADAVVKHERLEFIHQAATVVPRTHQYHHDSKDIAINGKTAKLTEVAASVIAQSTNPLVPIIASVSKMAKPSFKKDVINLSKGSPQILSAAEIAATEILPQAVETCDQDQIRFLGDLGANPMVINTDGKNALGAAGKTKCFKALSYWKKEQNIDFDKKNEEGISGFDVLSKFKDPELQSFTDQLQDQEVREIASLKPKAPRVSFYKKRVTSGIIDPEALVEPELRPDEATETAEFSEFSD